MKFIALILLCFLGWFGHVPFSHQQSTIETSIGGRPESGITKHYQIKLVAKTSSEDLKFDHLWIGIDMVKINAHSLNKEGQYQATFIKGDTIYIDAYQRFLPNEEGSLELQKEEDAAIAPIEYEGVAVLSYQIKGKRKYWTVEKFKELPKVYYP